VDPLSQILKALRLEAGIFFDAEFTTPWCIDSAPGMTEIEWRVPAPGSRSGSEAGAIGGPR